MTRGNQRELARQKTQKKQQAESKGKRKDGLENLTIAQRKQRDAERIQEKRLMKEKAKEEEVV
ncbi:hypothetical protein Ciccas_009771 [Cichlidogyrus casuarinus]|uniref:Small EDRK-rich factor-like N-terminal domain-containing protein n=1 Tax=Cichlidogyrus casuarinus TaxID=1844966 RepID=A0ABD2Q0K6_9PLAT